MTIVNNKTCMAFDPSISNEKRNVVIEFFMEKAI